VEIHGQHDERALVDTATIAACSTLSPASRRRSPRSNGCGTRAAPPAPHATSPRRHGARRARGDYLRHASDELKALDPQRARRPRLAERRTT